MRSSIRTKLMAILISSVLAMAIIGWQGILGMRDTEVMLNQVYENDFVPARLAANAETALIEWSRDTLNYEITKNELKKEEYSRRILQQQKLVLDNLQRLSQLPGLTEQETGMIRKLQENFNAALELWDNVTLTPGTGESAEKLEDMEAQLILVVDRLTADMTEFIRLQDSQIVEEKSSSDIHYRRIFIGISILTCVVLIAAALINFLMSRMIVGGLLQLVKGAEEVGKGNLDYHVDVSRKDELGQLALAFNRMAAERKHTEDALRGSEQKLRLLSSRLVNAHEEERKRIAVELHDSIGSSLSAIKFSLENNLKLLEESPTCFESLKSLASMTQNAMDEVRRIMTDLRPSMLDDLGLLTTIGWFCKQYRSIYPTIRLEEAIEVNEEEVADSLKIVIFRILQEALNNIAKYSKAELVKLSLRRKERGIELTIQDNGIGFDLQSVLSEKNAKKGLGLISMRERTEFAGGVFSIESVIEKGTTIHASWPST